MTETARTATTLLVLALGLAGCHGSGTPPSSPTAIPTTPTPVPQIVSGPVSNQPGYALTASSSTVSPGGELSVSWTVPLGGPLDWIGLFHVSASCNPGSEIQGGWWEYTNGMSSGTLTLRAPTVTGQYQFRYFPDDGCEIAARSAVVTVVAGG